MIRFEANRIQEISDTVFKLRTLGSTMHKERFSYNRTYSHPRIQRRIRILEDDLHISTERLELFTGGRTHIHFLVLLARAGQLFASEDDIPCSWIDHAENRPTSGRFPTATLPY